MFVLGERAGPCWPLIFWERQVNETKFLFYFLLQRGHFSAQPTHVVCGLFTTALGKKVREGQVRVFEQLLGGALDSWLQGFESLRSLLLGIDSALLPSSANSLLYTRPCFDPQEADYCGVHYQPPLPSAFLLHSADGKYQEKTGRQRSKKFIFPAPSLLG